MRFLSLWLVAAARIFTRATPLDPAYQNSLDQIRITQNAVLSASSEQVTPPLDGMVHRSLALSGPINNRVNLVFFGDGCERSRIASSYRYHMMFTDRF